MTNIRLKRRKEIDLLAVNIRTGQKFHVESNVSVSPSFGIRFRGLKKRGLGYIAREKFDHPIILEFVRAKFETEGYRRILVVGEMENHTIIDQGSEYGLEVWFLGQLLRELMVIHQTRGSRDDILRTIELVRTWYDYLKPRKPIR